MKHYCIFLLIMLAAYGCRPKGPAIISGTVRPGEYKDYKFVLYDGQNFTPVELDSTATRFTIQVNSDSLRFINLRAEVGVDDEKWAYSTMLYITPGRKIDLNIELYPYQGVTTILSEDNDNRALLEYLDQINGQQIIAWTDPPIPDKVANFLDNVYTLEDSILGKYRISDDVYNYIKIGSYIYYLSLKDAIGYMYSRDTNNYSLPEGLEQKMPSPDQILDHPAANQYNNAVFYIYQWLNRNAHTPEEKIQKLREHFTDPAIIRTTTEFILSHYITHYTYGDQFDKDFRRVQKMAETLPDKGKKLLQELTNKKNTARGAPLPEVYLENVKGEKCKLSDLKGSYLYIDFWASWCGPCCAEVPYLQQLEKQLKNPLVKFISISLDTKKEDWHNKMSRLNMHGEQYIVVNDELAKSLNINGIPHFLLYDKDGYLMQYEAPAPSTGASLLEMLESLK